MWYRQRGFGSRRFMVFPFMLMFWIIFASHSFVGIFSGIIMFMVVFFIVRALMGSAMMRNRSQAYYQPTQQQQPYYQPTQQQQQQPYYQPTYDSYEQGYQRTSERAQEQSYGVAEQPREVVQYEQPAQYEQPQAQYPEQMPPMQ